MGRGDKRTAKGKRFKGSFGKSRPAKKAAKKAAPKKSK
jgi:30S ribosomal protein S31